MKRKSPLHERISPLGQSSRTEARTQENNKGREENRAIRTAAAHGEDIGFPLAEQVARLLRQSTGRKDEEVALVTSASPERLDPATWLNLNRQGWGIENGLHQRLDISLNDDRCRVRSNSGIWMLGMFRRIAISLFMEWRSTRRRPDHVTTTSFQSLLAEDHRRRAVRLVTTTRPNVRTLS